MVAEGIGIAGLRPSVSDSDTPCGGWVVDGWWLKVLVLLDYDLVSQIVIHPVAVNTPLNSKNFKFKI